MLCWYCSFYVVTGLSEILQDDQITRLWMQLRVILMLNRDMKLFNELIISKLRKLVFWWTEMNFVLFLAGKANTGLTRYFLFSVSLSLLFSLSLSVSPSFNFSWLNLLVQKKIQDAISSRMRSTRKHEYKQLAVWYNEDEKSKQQNAETKGKPSHGYCELEWELL